MGDTRPYEDLKFYKDICEIRRMVCGITEKFPRTHMRLIAQMRDASRSAKQNIREGYRKGSLGEFLHSIRISQGSLEELGGDMEDCLEDRLISKESFEKFTKLYKSASYLSNQYIRAMNKPESSDRWKVPNKKQHPGTSRNLKEPSGTSSIKEYTS